MQKVFYVSDLCAKPLYLSWGFGKHSLRLHEDRDKADKFSNFVGNMAMQNHFMSMGWPSKLAVRVLAENIGD